jgi:hypothetical protein
VFFNLVEVIIDVAVALCVADSLTTRHGFDPPISTPGDALVAALARSVEASVKSGFAQVVTAIGMGTILFMLVVVIAAVVNNYQGGTVAKQEKPSLRVLRQHLAYEVHWLV